MGERLEGRAHRRVEGTFGGPPEGLKGRPVGIPRFAAVRRSVGVPHGRDVVPGGAPEGHVGPVGRGGPPRGETVSLPGRGGRRRAAEGGHRRLDGGAGGAIGAGGGGGGMASTETLQGLRGCLAGGRRGAVGAQAACPILPVGVGVFATGAAGRRCAALGCSGAAAAVGVVDTSDLLLSQWLVPGGIGSGWGVGGRRGGRQWPRMVLRAHTADNSESESREVKTHGDIYSIKWNRENEPRIGAGLSVLAARSTSLDTRVRASLAVDWDATCPRFVFHRSRQAFSSDPGPSRSQRLPFCRVGLTRPRPARSALAPFLQPLPRPHQQPTPRK